MKKLIAVFAVGLFLQACAVDLTGGAGAGGEVSVLGHTVAIENIGGELGAGASVGFTPTYTRK